MNRLVTGLQVLGLITSTGLFLAFMGYLLIDPANLVALVTNLALSFMTWFLSIVLILGVDENED